MIKISKSEKDYLVAHGLTFGTNGFEGDLHRTNSNKKTYYVTESRRAMSLLNKLRSTYEEHK